MICRSSLLKTKIGGRESRTKVKWNGEKGGKEEHKEGRQKGGRKGKWDGGKKGESEEVKLFP